MLNISRIHEGASAFHIAGHSFVFNYINLLNISRIPEGASAAGKSENA